MARRSNKRQGRGLASPKKLAKAQGLCYYNTMNLLRFEAIKIGG